MAAFFIKTDDSFVGPLTGVELREAAMAGVIRPLTQIAGSPHGPWTVAIDAGLFAENRTALPHPPDTQLALYHVRGLRIRARGPFRLRELIGFAAGGIMNRDASVQNSMQPDWYPAYRIGVLAACFEGHLLLSDDSPITNTRETIDVDPHGNFDSGCFQRTSKSELDASDRDAQPVPDPTPVSELSDDDGVRLNPKESRVSATKALLVVIGLAAAVIASHTIYSVWRDLGTQPDEIVGDWIAADDTFGIAFRQNGTCVVFNTAGNSWMGEYLWLSPDHKDYASSRQAADAPATGANAARSLSRADVESGDGYVRFRAQHEPVYLGNRRASGCFVRRSEDQLMIGFVAQGKQDENRKVTQAEWLTTNPVLPIGIDVMSSLAMEMDASRSAESSPVPHLAQVVSLLIDRYEMGDPDVAGAVETISGSRCYSSTVNAQYLLSSYGIPEEAGPVSPTNLADAGSELDLNDSQLVRYGLLELVLAADGSVQYASLYE